MRQTPNAYTVSRLVEQAFSRVTEECTVPDIPASIRWMELMARMVHTTFPHAQAYLVSAIIKERAAAYAYTCRVGNHTASIGGGVRWDLYRRGLVMASHRNAAKRERGLVRVGKLLRGDVVIKEYPMAPLRPEDIPTDEPWVRLFGRYLDQVSAQDRAARLGRHTPSTALSAGTRRL